MLHKAGIQEFLSRAKSRAISRVASKLEITVDKVLQDIETARLAALEAHPAPQCAAAIKASELHGRHIGMFRDDYADRDQTPMVVIRTGDGTQVAVMGREQSALTPPVRHIQPPPDVDEVLSDDDFL
jgi:hypothetical protein